MFLLQTLPVRHRQNIPPVLVELSVSKAEQLSCEVQGRVEEPIEKHQPEQMVRNLEEETGRGEVNVNSNETRHRKQRERENLPLRHCGLRPWETLRALTASLRSLSVILDTSMS